MRLALLLCLTASLPAQDITVRMYSEYQRVSPLGEIVPPDRGVTPREVISPAAARNSFASFHVAVTALPGTIYYIATQSYPHNVVQLRLYKESFELAGRDYIPDLLTEVPETALRVGIMPDYNAPDPSRTTEVYLLDVWIPPTTPPGIVRVEALVKTAAWQVAPIELRIVPATVPVFKTVWGPVSFIQVDAPADVYAWQALSAPVIAAPFPSTVRAVLRRNGLQDAALARRLDPARLFDRIWNALFEGGLSGAERFLPVRNYILRNSD